MKKSPNRNLMIIAGILVVILVIAVLFQSSERTDEVKLGEPVTPPAITAPSSVSPKPSAAEMIPVYTGGAGGNSSLGGTSSVGGGSHH